MGVEGVPTGHAQELLIVLPVPVGVGQGTGLNPARHSLGEPAWGQLGKLRTDSRDSAVEDEPVCRVDRVLLAELLADRVHAGD